MPIANTCSIGYPHDGRADNAAYRHDRRADNAAYRHDRRADSLSRKIQFLEDGEKTVVFVFTKSKIQFSHDAAHVKYARKKNADFTFTFLASPTH